MVAKCNQSYASLTRRTPAALFAPFDSKAQALMSDENLEVVMDDDPLMPQVSRHPKGVGEALVTNFFDRDPYTRRHRSRSMAEFPVANQDLEPTAATTDAVGNGVGNGHVAGVPRLVSAEV